MSVKWHRLGDLVERIERPNADGKFGVEDVRGVSNTKLIQRTKASMDGRDFTPFTILNPGEFIFNRRTTRNGERLGLGFNQDNRPYIFTEDYVAFRVKDERKLIPAFLYVFFLRNEFDRYVRWDSWGSATEFFNWENMCEVEIPVPPISEQRKVVEAWQGLRTLKEQNEQLAAPLLALCRSYLQELKKTWPMVEIGPMITRTDVRNADNSIRVVKSVSVTKELKDTNAKVDKSQLQSYKIVLPGNMSFVQTTGNEKCLCIAVNNLGEPIVVTSVNEVFHVDESRLMADFLYLWWCRKESDRYARFHSWGSARETFNWDDMCRVKIPLPPLEIQQAVIDLYRCANEAKKIAAEAEAKSREICPALMQWVVKEGA